MKTNYLLLIVLSLCSITVSARENYAEWDGSCLVKTKNLYVYDGQIMNKGEYRDFLIRNSTQAYQSFRQGRGIAALGWILFAGGGITFLTSWSDGSVPYITPCVVGGVIMLTAVPALAIGYKDMRKSVDIFNAERCKAQTKLNVGLAIDQNGVGLAIQF